MKYKLTLLSLLLSTSAQAWDGEIGIGISKFTSQPDGIWYQSPFAHQINLTSPSASIGITGMIFDDLRFHIGYKYLGQVTSKALAVGNDAIYNQYGAQANKHMALSTWLGKGQVNMLYATIAPEWKRGNWTIYTETGVTLYKPTWDMRIPDWVGTPNTQPTPLTVKANSYPVLGGTIGLGVKYKATDIVLQVFDMHMLKADFPAIYCNHTTSLTLRHTF